MKESVAITDREMRAVRKHQNDAIHQKMSGDDLNELYAATQDAIRALQEMATILAENHAPYAWEEATVERLREIAGDLEEVGAQRWVG